MTPIFLSISMSEQTPLLSKSLDLLLGVELSHFLKSGQKRLLSLSCSLSDLSPRMHAQYCLNSSGRLPAKGESGLLTENDLCLRIGGGLLLLISFVIISPIEYLFDCLAFIKLLLWQKLSSLQMKHPSQYQTMFDLPVYCNNNYNFMKKKVEQKKEIVPIMQPGLFWEYKQYTAESLEKIDAFFTNFTNELKALIVLERSLQENYEVLCEKMGLNAHPSLSRKASEASQFPTLKNNDYGERYAIFLNHRIDAATLKLFGFLISIYKLHSLKISNNSLENQTEQVRKILEKEDQLTTLYFEWNPLIEHPRRRELFLTCVRPSLQHLILRQCKIGNQVVKQVLKKIREITDCKLKSLDLYGNDITPEITTQICEFVEENKSIQFLGLSKNSLGTDEFLKPLFSSIGEVPLSEEQYEQHRLKEKARDEVIERNKKRKKGAPEEPVPFVFEVKDTANGKVYVKNTCLKILNLASNNIKDASSVLVRKLIEGNGKHLELFIEGNKFSKTVKETLKFYENVIS